MITNGFYYLAVVVLIPAVCVMLEKRSGWKVWKVFPAFVFVYLVNMLFCTFGVWDLEATSPAYSAVKNNLLYAMIPLMLSRCDVRKLAKLGPKLVITFLGSALSMCAGIVLSYMIFGRMMGETSSHAAAALIGSWIGGSDNMVAVQAVLNVPEGDMGACIIIDNLYYSVWIAFLLWAPAVAGWFNKFTKADTSYLDNIEIDADDLLTQEPARVGMLEFQHLGIVKDGQLQGGQIFQRLSLHAQIDIALLGSGVAAAADGGGACRARPGGHCPKEQRQRQEQA